MIIISTNDNEPNNAAYILLFYDTFAIFAFFKCYNPAKHTRRLIPFNIMDQLPEDGQQAPNIFQDVIDLSSDSEDDEVVEHWPPGLQFLDGEDFILGNLHHNAAPAAWKRANSTFEDLMLHPNKMLFSSYLLRPTVHDHEYGEQPLHGSPALHNSIKKKGVNELSN